MLQNKDSKCARWILQQGSLNWSLVRRVRKTVLRLMFLLEKLNKTLERGELWLDRLVSVLEKMDEYMSSLTILFEILVEG